MAKQFDSVQDLFNRAFDLSGRLYRASFEFTCEDCPESAALLMESAQLVERAQLKISHCADDLSWRGWKESGEVD